MANYQYPATIESNGEGGFIASFRDVPEAITEAWDLEELKINSQTPARKKSSVFAEESANASARAKS